MRAGASLERGQRRCGRADARPGAAPSLTRDEELTVRSMLAEAALLQDDLDQAADARSAGLPTPSATPCRRGGSRRCGGLHGRLASARGDQSRAIAMHGRALKQAEAAHDSRAIGLAHYELGQCYRQVGDVAIVREHISKAASRAARGRRPPSPRPCALAVEHLARAARSLRRGDGRRCGTPSGSPPLCRPRTCSPPSAAIRPNVMMLQHRYEQALALAERSVSLHEAHGSGHGLAVALATLGQICVRLGDLRRAEEALHRALDVRSPIQFHETTGAVFDTLAQIHLIRGRYDTASDFLGRASEAFGAYGRQTSQWYEVVRARCSARASRCGARALDDAVARVDEILQAGAPPFDALAGDPDRRRGADRRQPPAGSRTAPRRGRRRARSNGRARPHGASTCVCAARSTPRSNSGADAYHDFSQSAALLDLLGERYQSALSHLALGRLVAETGARSVAGTPLEQGARRSSSSSAPTRDIDDTHNAQSLAHRCRHRPVRRSPRRCRRCHRPPDRGCGGAARSARARDGVIAAGSRGRRLRGRSTSRLAGGDVRVVATAGWDDEAGAHAGAIGRTRQRLRPRRHRHRTARARCRGTAIRTDRVAPADRASGDAPVADDCRRRAARDSRCARRAIDPSPSPGSTVDRAVARAAAARDSCQPAPR